jgi:hypothetical protein
MSGVIPEHWIARGYASLVPRTLATVVLIAFVLAGCAGRQGAATQTSPTTVVLARAIPGAPNVPRWLRARTWQTAASLNDPHPAQIVVRLRIREHGRIVDRVWMRGNFVCNDCSHGLTRTALPRGHLSGFTVDDSTHQTLSFSITRG